MFRHTSGCKGGFAGAAAARQRQLQTKALVDVNTVLQRNTGPGGSTQAWWDLLPTEQPAGFLLFRAQCLKALISATKEGC